MMAVCGILERDGRVLLCRRLPCVRYPGLWELPTFEYEGSGTVEETLERGLFERLSLKSEQLSLFSAQNMRRTTGCRTWSYKVERWNGSPFLSGYGAYRFVSPKNLHRFPMIPGFVTIVNKYFSFKGKV